jgi:hypothetical protein
VLLPDFAKTVRRSINVLVPLINRLASASGSGWSETYGFDAFGNLLSKAQTGGAPTLSQAANPANNQIVGQTYDANGNQLTAPGVTGTLAYDVENRLVTAPGVQYAYDSQNKRVWVGKLDSSGNLLSQTAYFFGLDGKKLGAYTLTVSGTQFSDPPAETDVYFAGRRVYVNGQIFSEDRLVRMPAWRCTPSARISERRRPTIKSSSPPTPAIP